jgi:uncharacterized damage-inducible protein DinB
MKAVDKNQLLDALENKVEGHIREAIKVFQNTDSQTLLQAAPNGGWSIAQCLEHLNWYGHYYLPQIQKGLSQPAAAPVPDTFRSTWLGAYFTRLMDPETSKKKQKAFKNYIPPAHLDAYAVVAEFIQEQETLLVYLKQARQADLNRIKIPISIMKWLKLRLGDVFQFLIAHNERHMVQARKNLVPQPEKVSA